jgi:DHA1 family bicyclomycin/chloramphenicol resistance-like MFS transporter
MGRVSMIFALAPVIAPAVGAWIHVVAGWRAVFWFLAGLAVALWALTYFRLPETLPPVARQPFSPGYLRAVYLRAATTRPFLLLAFTQSFSFAGLFLYIAAAPVFMLEHLNSGHDRFFMMFAASVAGMFMGSFIVERLAGRLAPEPTVRLGLILQACAVTVNLAYCALATPSLPWAVLPLTLYCTGMYIAKPPVAIAALDHFPQNRGLASAFQAFMQTLLNAAVAGALAPLLSASPLTLAAGLAAATALSATFWWLHGRRIEPATSAPSG